MGQYLPVVVLMVLAVLFAAVSFLASRLLAPRRSTAAKRAPYECGIVPTKEPPERFPVRFYLVAMSFIVFDIEIIFLFPWATIYRTVGVFGLVAVVLFSIPIFVSLAYEFSQGALDWGPAKREDPASMPAPARASTTSVRRVGLEGRTPLGTEAA